VDASAHRAFVRTYHTIGMKKNNYITNRERLVVKRSFAGLGLFTKEPIKKGDFIIEYTGTRLTTAQSNKKGGKYLFIVNKSTVLDGFRRDNLARYANHCCKPNSEIDVKHGRILLFARRAIRAGEEITYDYGDEYFDEIIKPKGCLCAACTQKGMP